MDGKLRHIESLQTLTGLFTFTFDSRNPTSYAKYSNLSNLPLVGEPIQPDNNLISDLSSGKVYLREGNALRHIITGAVFDKYHFNWNAVQNISSVSNTGYVVGLPLY